MKHSGKSSYWQTLRDFFKKHTQAKNHHSSLSIPSLKLHFGFAPENEQYWRNVGDIFPEISLSEGYVKSYLFYPLIQTQIADLSQREHKFYEQAPGFHIGTFPRPPWRKHTQILRVEVIQISTKPIRRQVRNK